MAIPCGGGKLLLAEEVKVPRENQRPLEGKLWILETIKIEVERDHHPCDRIWTHNLKSLESSDTVFKTAQTAKDPTQIIISLKTVDHTKIAISKHTRKVIFKMFRYSSVLIENTNLQEILLIDEQFLTELF